MATLFITELSTLAKGIDGTIIPVASMPPEMVQTVTFTTAVASTAFAGTTKFVRIYSDTNCAIRFGENPTAVVTDTALAANIPEYFGVRPRHMVSAIVRP